MSNEPSESSTNFSNFSMNSSPGSINTPEPLLDLVNSLMNSASNSNNFMINTPNFITSTRDTILDPGGEAVPAQEPTNERETSRNRTIGITPNLLQVRGRRYEIPTLHSIPERNPLMDFLNFVDNDIITPPPPPLLPSPPPLINAPQRTESDEGNTESTDNDVSDAEPPPLGAMRRNSIIRAINRGRNRNRGVFFQQFMSHLMDNADEQILQQVMHESFVEDQEKRLIDQARELDIEQDKYDKNNKTLENFSTCRICFSEYKDGEEIGILPCQHFFHCACIQEWGKRRPVCPFCDIDIPTVNEQAAKKQKTS